MKKTLIILTLFAAVSCSGQTKHSNMETIQNDTTYTVWTTYNFEGETSNWSELDVNYEFVQSLPTPVKAIIARYTNFIIGMDKEIELNFAQALGGFTTLEEARQTLLKDWKVKNISVKTYIYSLELKETKQSLSIRYFDGYNNKWITNEFIIDKNGKIILK